MQIRIPQNAKKKSECSKIFQMEFVTHLAVDEFRWLLEHAGNAIIKVTSTETVPAIAVSGIEADLTRKGTNEKDGKKKFWKEKDTDLLWSWMSWVSLVQLTVE